MDLNSDSEDEIEVNADAEEKDDGMEQKEAAEEDVEEEVEEEEVEQTDAAEAAVRQAEAEGLTLQQSDNMAGYRGVHLLQSRSRRKPFQASVWRAGKHAHLGVFFTAEEAALAFARTPEAQAQVANPKAVPFTAEEAVAQATAEELTLQTSNNAAGYRGVKLDRSRYQASVSRAGKWVHLGSFATAEEAALVYARTSEAQAQVANPKAVPLTAEEVVAQAAAEGLTLEPANSTTGYKGVTARGECSRYQAFIKRGVKNITLGTFATPEEAALTVARATARTTTPADPPSPPPESPPATRFDSDSDDGIEIEEDEAETEEVDEYEEVDVEVIEEDDEDEEQDATVAQTDATEAVVSQVKAEGLTLQPSNNKAGYRCVYVDHDCKVRPFSASVRRAGKREHLGSFATAEEAALVYARTPEAQAQVAKSTPVPSAKLTAEEAVAQATAERLTLEPGNGASGYKGVGLHGRRCQAYVYRAGKQVQLGCFGNAEEAALAVARADARPTAVPRPATAKRVAPPPKAPPAKQPRNSLAPRPLHSVAMLTRDPPPASQALGAKVAAAPAPTIFKDKLALLKRELEIEPAIPAIPAIAEANKLLGITPSDDASLSAQLDAILAAISNCEPLNMFC